MFLHSQSVIIAQQTQKNSLKQMFVLNVVCGTGTVLYSSSFNLISLCVLEVLLFIDFSLHVVRYILKYGFCKLFSGLLLLLFKTLLCITSY